MIPHEIDSSRLRGIKFGSGADLASVLDSVQSPDEEACREALASLEEWPYQPVGGLEAIPYAIQSILWMLRLGVVSDPAAATSSVASLCEHSEEYTSFDSFTGDAPSIRRSIHQSLRGGCDVFLNQLKSEVAEQRHAASTAVRVARLEELCPILANHLSTESDDKVVQSLLRALADLSAVGLRDIVERFLKATDHSTRAYAAYAIARADESGFREGVNLLASIALPTSFPEWDEDAGIEAHTLLVALGERAVEDSWRQWVEVARKRECRDPYRYLMQIVFHRFPPMPRPDFSHVPLTECMSEVLRIAVRTDEFWSTDLAPTRERERVLAGRYGLPTTQPGLIDRLQHP